MTSAASRWTWEATVIDQQQTPGDAVMTRIGQAAMLLHGGDREEARHRFASIWAEISDAGDPLHLCTLARYMADAQDDPDDELAWDLRALAAAEGQSEARGASQSGVGGGSGGEMRGASQSGVGGGSGGEMRGESQSGVDGGSGGEMRGESQSGVDGESRTEARRGESPCGVGREGRTARHEQSLAVRALYPSLHLDLAADYIKLRRPEAARAHLDRARAATDALADDGYGNGVRTAIDRLERTLGAG
ncbi:hypothetical protein [Streptomyces sp. NPDC018833]|uniref:hypothetical protein n=1 Tax=Streptomyces sp. NPDC018833 TaxID=3365053 RepID=UPI003790CE23